MRTIFTGLAALALWAGPASGFSHAADVYSPGHNDLIWPYHDYFRAYTDRGYTEHEALEAWKKTPRGRRADDLCQAAWERTERIRVELGLRSGSKVAPHDPLLPPGVCEAILAMPEDEVRAVIEEMTEICDGDCRDLLRSSRR